MTNNIISSPYPEPFYTVLLAGGWFPAVGGGKTRDILQAQRLTKEKAEFVAKAWTGSIVYHFRGV